jgi:hypothetical protein
VTGSGDEDSDDEEDEEDEEVNKDGPPLPLVPRKNAFGWISNKFAPRPCVLCAYTARYFNLPFSADFKDPLIDDGDACFRYETVYVHYRTRSPLHLDCLDILRERGEFSNRVLFGFGNGDGVFCGEDGDRVEGYPYAWGGVNSWSFARYVQFITKPSQYTTYNPTTSDVEAISRRGLPEFATGVVDATSQEDFDLVNYDLLTEADRTKMAEERERHALALLEAEKQVFFL